MIDVDYYIDMPSYLADEFKPTILYTFQPEAVARDDGGEYSYTFNAKNEVIYNVSGGGSYNHEVWNYNCDHILVTKRFLGFPWRVAAYNVDRRRAGPDHELVCLTPLRRWTGPFAFLGAWLGGRELERLQPVEGEFLRMKVQRDDGVYVSTGEINRYAAATIGVKYDDAIAISSKTTTVKLSLPTVLAYIPGDNLVERKVQASALLNYHRNRNPALKPSEAFVFPVKEAVRNYDYGVESFDPDAKQTLTAFMSPLIHGAFAPLASRANEEKCVSGRITQFATKKGELRLTEFLDRTMREFCELLLPAAHTMEPTTIDEVYARQARPSQQRILDESLTGAEPERKVKMFMKKEAYGEPKEPRPISTINGVDKREYSRYLYPIADLIKTCDWYAFGKTPKDIAQRVTEVLDGANSAVNTDFSRFDGRVSELLRILERMLLVRAFRTEYTRDVTELHNSQFTQSAIGTFGTRYNTGYARASGSPETAAFNSIANAYVAYLTFRMTREGGAFIAPEVAWKRLGIYGGDDGLTADVDPSKYSRAAGMLGLKLDVELINRGDEGITFLSRMYGPHVWYGDANSCCDLPRQLAKLHTTVSLPPNVTPLEKLLEKARAFFLTDAKTPILGELVTKIVTLHGPIAMDKKTANIRAWNSDTPREVQYPNQNDGWMDAYAVRALEPFGFDFELFHGWLNSVTSVEQTLTPPLCAEPKRPKNSDTIIVDEDVVAREEQKAKPIRKSSTPKTQPRRNTTTRERSSRGKPANAEVKRRPQKTKAGDDTVSVNSRGSNGRRRPRKAAPKSSGKGGGSA